MMPNKPDQMSTSSIHRRVLLRMRGPFSDFELVEGMDPDILSKEKRISDIEEIGRQLSFLALFDDMNLYRLRRLAAQRDLGFVHHENPVRAIAEDIQRGRLYLRELEHLKYDLQSEPPYLDDLPPGPSDGSGKPATTYIAIQLNDKDGNPVGNEPYKIRLPDGEVKYGNLDGKGFAKITGVPRGIARVSFPERDKGDFRVETQDEGSFLSFVEMTVEDEDGRPLEVVFSATSAAGESAEYQTTNGLFRLDGLEDAGRFKVEIQELRHV